MASASAPNDDPAEALFGEGCQDRQNEGVVQIDGNVYVTCRVVSVLWCGPKGNSRKHERLNAVLSVGLFGRSGANLLHEPGIEVYREVRPLLLGASRGNYGQPVLAGPFANLFVCEVAVSHM